MFYEIKLRKEKLISTNQEKYLQISTNQWNILPTGLSHYGEEFKFLLF